MHRRVVFRSRFDLRKKIFFDVITFESKLEKLIKVETKVLHGVLVSFLYNKGANHVVFWKKVFSFSDERKSADAQAGWLEGFVKSVLKNRKSSKRKGGNKGGKTVLIETGLSSKWAQVTAHESRRRPRPRGVNSSKKAVVLKVVNKVSINRALSPNFRKYEHNGFSEAYQSLCSKDRKVTITKSSSVLGQRKSDTSCKKLKPKPKLSNFRNDFLMTWRKLKDLLKNNILGNDCKSMLLSRERSRLAKSLLLLAGDVEKNPGPRPQGNPGQQDDNTLGEGQTMDTMDTRGSYKKQCHVKALTYNVRGLNDRNKMRHLINVFNKEYCSKEFDAIIALQETNIAKPGLIPYIFER